MTYLVFAVLTLPLFRNVAMTVPPWIYTAPNTSVINVDGYKLVYTDLMGRCLSQGKNDALTLKERDPCTWLSIPGNIKFGKAMLVSVAGRCQKYNVRNSPLTADVAANSGSTTIALRSFGCRVLAVEPRNDMQSIIEATLDVNGWLQDGSVLQKSIAVADYTGSVEIEGYTLSSKPNIFTNPVVPFASIIHEPLQYLSLDIDGFDGAALRSLLTIIDTTRISNIAFEMWICHWHKYSNISVNGGINLVNQLFNNGYKAWIMKEPYEDEDKISSYFRSINKKQFSHIVPECCRQAMKCGHAAGVIDVLFSIDADTIRFIGSTPSFLRSLYT